MAFLGIRVPHEMARLLGGVEVPGKKVAVSDMHITLLHFTDNWPISEMAKALEASYDVISKAKPFLVKTQVISCFPAKGDQPSAIIARVESPELHKVRDKLGAEFDKEKIDFSKDFKTYNPHITLSYSDKEIEDFEIDTVEFSVPEIVLWGGDHGDDRIFITFALKCPEKHSMIKQRAEIFRKIASNPPQDYFTPTFERRGAGR